MCEGHPVHSEGTRDAGGRGHGHRSHVSYGQRTGPDRKRSSGSTKTRPQKRHRVRVLDHGLFVLGDTVSVTPFTCAYRTVDRVPLPSRPTSQWSSGYCHTPILSPVPPVSSRKVLERHKKKGGNLHPWTEHSIKPLKIDPSFKF